MPSPGSSRNGRVWRLSVAEPSQWAILEAQRLRTQTVMNIALALDAARAQGRLEGAVAMRDECSEYGLDNVPDDALQRNAARTLGLLGLPLAAEVLRLRAENASLRDDAAIHARQIDLIEEGLAITQRPWRSVADPPPFKVDVLVRVGRSYRVMSYHQEGGYEEVGRYWLMNDAVCDGDEEPEWWMPIPPLPSEKP